MKRLLNLLMRLAVAVIIVVILSYMYRQYHLYVIEKEIFNDLTERIATEQATQERILYELEHHLSDEYVEQVARNQLGLVKSTEILFVDIYQ